MSQRGVFLDRDGTLIEEVGYLDRKERVDLYPWTIDAVRALNRAGFRAVLVSNQSGVARGFFSETVVDEVHEHIAALLESGGAHIDAYYYCPHHPDGKVKQYAVQCECRKPKPGLILEGARRHPIDLARSYMVGDTGRDLGAARAAGLPLVLIDAPYNQDLRPDYRVAGVVEAAALIVKLHAARPMLS